MEHTFCGGSQSTISFLIAFSLGFIFAVCGYFDFHEVLGTPFIHSYLSLNFHQKIFTYARTKLQVNGVTLDSFD